MRPAVLIPTCDAYEWVWEGWNKYFQKYWCHELGWDVYFMTEEKDISFLGVKNIKSGKGNFSDRMKKGFELINSDYIFYAQEDMWAKEKVNAKIFSRLFEIFLEREIDVMRVQHRCKHYTLSWNFLSRGLRVEKLDRSSDYLFSLQPSFWKKSYFLDIIESGEDPWQMEIEGTKRLRNSNNNDKIYFYEYPWYEETVNRGKWWNGKLAKLAKKGEYNG